jgi:bifunctional oligoribonuclease and PAP phosphatase NrnA
LNGASPGAVRISAVATDLISDFLDVPQHRETAIRQLAEELTAGRLVALSTHVNADGDGCGSEVALSRLLAQIGVRSRIVNPTPWPAPFDFLLHHDIDEKSSRGSKALRDADVLLVVDISDVTRLGNLAGAVRELKVPKLVIDHHVATDEPAGEISFSDTTACATGELVYDLAKVLDLEITPRVADGLYVAILTDTGSFRFSNTTPRALAIAADLLGRGVDPEAMYQRVYASAPIGRLRVLAESLATLGYDEKLGLTWLSLDAGALDRHGIKSEDIDGIVEHARSIAGTRLALFFRELPGGKVKVSFRSTAGTDANAFARRFGGGGHVRASGALMSGSLPDVIDRVVSAAREYLGGSAGR